MPSASAPTMVKLRLLAKITMLIISICTIMGVPRITVAYSCLLYTSYAFIDSDDVVRPAYLKKMYEACEAHDAYMAICAVEDVQENGKPLPEPVFTPPTQEGVFRGKDLLLSLIHISPWPCVARQC